MAARNAKSAKKNAIRRGVSQAAADKAATDKAAAEKTAADQAAFEKAAADKVAAEQAEAAKAASEKTGQVTPSVSDIKTAKQEGGPSAAFLFIFPEILALQKRQLSYV